MNTNTLSQPARLNFAPMMAGAASSALASRHRPGSMLLAALLQQMAGGRQQDEVSALAKELRVINERFTALFNDAKLKDLPALQAATEKERTHKAAMYGPTEAKAQSEQKLLPTVEQLKANDLTTSNLSTGAARAFAVPTGRKNPDGSAEMRAMTPLEIKASEHQQQQEFDQAAKLKQFDLVKAGQNWDEDALPAGATDSTENWMAWMKSIGQGEDIMKSEAASYSPKAADKVHRETAAKHVQFLSDLQRRLQEADATNSSVFGQLAAIVDGGGGNGPMAMQDQPKVKPETMQRIMAIEQRKNAIYNRLANPALFGEKDQPLFTLQPDEFKTLVAPPPPPSVPAPGAAAQTAPAAPAPPMGMNAPPVRLPPAETLGQQLFPGGIWSNQPAINFQPVAAQPAGGPPATTTPVQPLPMAQQLGQLSADEAQAAAALRQQGYSKDQVGAELLRQRNANTR